LSTLYIRLPSKAAADNAAHWLTLACPFALTDAGAVVGEGCAPLADLAVAIAKAQRVVLLVAASDVTLLQAQLPPLSAARLKAALPNLLEDQLMSDPAELVFVPGPLVEGVRTVAVMHRGWLEILSHTLFAFGARNLSAVPAQFSLPFDAGHVSAAAISHDGDVDLVLRLSAHGGIGLPIFPDDASHEAAEVVQTLCAIVPTAAITLFVAQAKVNDFQHAANSTLALDQRITVYAENWPRVIAATAQCRLNLLSALGGASGPAFDWRPWRWPIALVALVLLVNVIGLNLDWWRQKREAGNLRDLMTQTFKSAYPREAVVLDPVLQMRQKITAAQRESGQPAADDFIVLAANFGAAWEVAGGGKPAATVLAGMDYRERSLFLRVKPDAALPLDALKPALAERQLSLAPAGNNIWQIRSVK
jgi:general secretion pathway protein L